MIDLVFLVLLIVQWIHTSRIVDTRTVTEKQGRDVILTCRFERLQERDRVMWLVMKMMCMCVFLIVW